MTHYAHSPPHLASGETFKLQINKEQDGTFPKVHNICKITARHQEIIDVNAYYIKFNVFFFLFCDKIESYHFLQMLEI